MQVTYSVHVDGISEIREALSQACSQAEHAVAVEVEKDTTPFVPALTGSLTERTHVTENLVVYPGPYARFLYYGKVMVDPVTGSPYASEGATKVLTDRDLVFTKTMHPQAQAFWCEASKAQNLEKWKRIAQKAVNRYGKD